MAFAAFVASGASAQDRPPPPNILLIVADDLGYGDLSCYGSRRFRTPHLDALAAEGVRFTQFRVNPLCAPTRATLLTGLSSLESGMWRGPSRAGAEDEGEEQIKGTEPGSGKDASNDRPARRRRRDAPGGNGSGSDPGNAAPPTGAGTRGGAGSGRPRELHPDLVLLPQHLKAAGYATGLFGKWHLGYTPHNIPNDRGFDEFVGFLGGAHPYAPGRGEPIQKNGKPLTDDRHLTDLFTDEAVAFLKSHRSEPFFCQVAYNAVHGPLWSKDRPNASAKPEWLTKAAERGLEFPERDYAATLEHLDDSVGRLLTTLRKLGIERQTVVLFVSDNGAPEEIFPGDNGPLRGQKGETYEGGIRVPAAIRWPGVIPAGIVSNASASAADLFATAIEAAGHPVPATNGRFPVHGVSLLPHARSGGAKPLPDRYLFWDLYGDLGVFHDGWKLVGQIDNHHGRFAEALPKIDGAKFELYYIPDDIGEQHDLVQTRPEIAADLKRRLVAWFKASSELPPSAPPPPGDSPSSSVRPEPRP